MTQPKYDLDKIKFATDEGTYKRAVGLYESGKVLNFTDHGDVYTAMVQGTHLNEVEVGAKHYDRGYCNCYLGARDVLYKHMIAVAIYAVLRGEKIPKRDQDVATRPVCSQKLGELTKEELSQTRKMITNAVRLIKPYLGPSSTWFAYQASLREGVNRLSAIVSELPVSYQTADLLVKLFVRLDKKLSSSGVDDSDGIVGGFLSDLVEVLQKYAKLDTSCIKAFKRLADKPLSFEIEDPLVEIYRESLGND